MGTAERVSRGARVAPFVRRRRESRRVERYHDVYLVYIEGCVGIVEYYDGRKDGREDGIVGGKE
jgi:hypothetical protein